MKTHRLLELDALRGIAALTVVLYHYFYRYDQLYGHSGISVNWAEFGQFGVQLFFMISGFVIYWTLERIARPMDFVVSRVSRLFPAYWTAIIITFSVVHMAGLPGRETSLAVALANATMLQEFLRIPSVDGVYWTLTVELIFYFWIFAAFLSGCLNRIEIILALPVMISIGHSLGWYGLNPAINKLFLIPYAAFFLSGICLFKLADGKASSLTKGSLAISLLSLLLSTSLQVFLLFTCFHLVFFLAVSGRLGWLASRPFVFLGSLSYSLYLLHQNIGYVIIRTGYEYGLPAYASILTALAVSLALAAVVSRYIERPAMNHIRQAWKRRSKVKQPAG